MPDKATKPTKQNTNKAMAILIILQGIIGKNKATVSTPSRAVW
jgi:hypothetical protein